MNSKNLAGVGICCLVFGASFLLGDGRALLFNLMGLMIVFSGTAGATFFSYPFEDIRAAFHVARNSYTENPPTAERIVNVLLDLSVRSRREGILSLEKEEKQATVIFLRDALGMLVDGYRDEELREILITEMYFFKQRRQKQERIFRSMASLAPAFGITGSVAGLLGMLAGVGDTGVILQTIPVALTSTLYGIVLSNLILTPVAESIYSKTQRELLMQKLIVEGVSAILKEKNPHKLQKKLETFLTPDARPENQKTFEEIRNRYRKTMLDHRPVEELAAQSKI